MLVSGEKLSLFACIRAIGLITPEVGNKDLNLLKSRKEVTKDWLRSQKTLKQKMKHPSLSSFFLFQFSTILLTK
jgi:hypothetical protein